MQNCGGPTGRILCVDGNCGFVSYVVYRMSLDEAEESGFLELTGIVVLGIVWGENSYV